MSRLARVELARRPRVTSATAVAGSVLGALLAGAAVDALGSISRTVAAILLIAGAAAHADATSPRQQDDAAVLVRLGCPRSAVWLAAALSTVLALGVPAALGAFATGTAGLGSPGSGSLWFPSLALAALGAATTCGSRLPPRRSTTRVATFGASAVRVGIGSALLLAAGSIPALSQTGSDLDLSLPLGTVAAIAGLAVLAPVLARAAATVLGWLPWTAPRVAAGTLRTRSRSLTVPVALVAGLVCVLVVQGVVGQALERREQARVDLLRTLGPASTGGGPTAVVLQQRLLPTAASTDVPLPLDDVRSAAGPGADVGPIDLLQAAALPSGGTVGTVSRADGLFGSRDDGAVALATPELLRALGLDESLWESDRPLVLDDRLRAPDGTVHLVARDVSAPADRSDTGLRLAAVDAVPGEVWVGVPGVLLPRGAVTAIDLGTGIDGAIVSDPGGVPTGAIVRFPQRPTSEQIRRFGATSATGVSVERGDREVDLRQRNRTDRAGSVWVRTAGETRDLAVGAGVVALAALAVALVTLRLAVRDEDALLLQLGARRRTLVAISSLRALALTAGAAAVGAAVGLLATAFGMLAYDRRGRLADEVVLDPLRWSLPGTVAAAVLVLPLLAALLGAVVAGGRRGDPGSSRTPGGPGARN